MLILAADTSGKHGSIALAQCEGTVCAALDVVPLTGGTFSAQLVPQIAALLARHGLSKTDIVGFAVASGPGSFTGLRVGLAAIKALADVLNTPVAAISLLEAVALSAGIQGEVRAALDAGRGEVYVGDYQVNGSGAHLVAERLLGLDSLGKTAALLVTPDKAVVDAARAWGLHVLEVDRPESDVIARLGWQRIQAGQTVSPEELDANYIRRSDAEILAKTKS